MRRSFPVLLLLPLLIIGTLAAQKPAAANLSAANDSIRISDLYRLRSTADPQLSPDGTHIAFLVSCADRPGFPYTRIYIGDWPTKQVDSLVEGTSPRWSPDGSRLAYLGTLPGGTPGIIIVNKDGTGLQKIADYQTSNHPWPMVGNRLVARRPSAGLSLGS